MISTKGEFVKHLTQTLVVQQSVTKIISLIFANLVTPIILAQHNLLFNKPASEVGLLNI